jgi:ESX secretion system protein EccE
VTRPEDAAVPLPLPLAASGAADETVADVPLARAVVPTAHAEGSADTTAGARAAPAASAVVTGRRAAWATAAAASHPGRDPGHDPAPADPEGDDPAADDVRPGARPSALRIGWHRASVATLGRLRTPPLAAGLIVGESGTGPVPVRFFSAEPVRATVVGDHRLARVLVLRAFALGACAVVVTGDPARWRDLAAAATGQPDRLVVLVREQPITTFAAAGRPALIVHDVGAGGPSGAVLPGPWQTQLTLLPRVERAGLASLGGRDVLLSRRLDAAEAALMASALRLPQASVRELRALPDDALALIRYGGHRSVRLVATAVERRLAEPAAP